MDVLIRKAAKSNRAAMTELYKNNVTAVYCLASALLQSKDQAIPATNQGIKSALQAAGTKTIQTEAEFAQFALTQTADYCKKEVLKKDPKAFQLPAKRDFSVSHIKQQYMESPTTDVGSYIRCMPAIQRFTFVLRHLGNMDDLQIGTVIGLDTATVALVKAAEAENLANIHRMIGAADEPGSAPTPETVCGQFRSGAILPDAVCESIEKYIASVASYADTAAMNKQKKLRNLAMVALIYVAALIVIIYGIKKTNEYTSTSGSNPNQTPGTSDATDPTGESTGSLDPSLIYYADIVIKDYGTITVELDQKAAPITVENFVNLAKSGFYNGLTFHRIIEGFMMQGGCPEGTGYGGSGKTIHGEFYANGYDNPLSHTRGAISMARSGAYNSASSQFFIVHQDSIDSLDGKYAAFGYVVTGMDVVDKVCETAKPIDGNGSIAAKNQPKITSITIRTEAPEADTATE